MDIPFVLSLEKAQTQEHIQMRGRKPIELTKDSIIAFGKYKGRTIDEVLYNDAPYLKWMNENVTTIRFSAELKDELNVTLANQSRTEPDYDPDYCPEAEEQSDCY